MEGRRPLFTGFWDHIQFHTVKIAVFQNKQATAPSDGHTNKTSFGLVVATSETSPTKSKDIAGGGDILHHDAVNILCVQENIIVVCGSL